MECVLDKIIRERKFPTYKIKSLIGASCQNEESNYIVKEIMMNIIRRIICGRTKINSDIHDKFSMDIRLEDSNDIDDIEYWLLSLNDLFHETNIFSGRYNLTRLKYEITHNPIGILDNYYTIEIDFTMTYNPGIIFLIVGTHSRQTRSLIYEFSRSPLYDRNLFRILDKLSG